jgi:hypothetical protein
MRARPDGVAAPLPLTASAVNALHMGFIMTCYWTGARAFASLRAFAPPLAVYGCFGNWLLSIKLNNRLRWKTGWQYYRCREHFGLFSIFQDYRAHTGYVSLLWSF